MFKRFTVISTRFLDVASLCLFGVLVSCGPTTGVAAAQGTTSSQGRAVGATPRPSGSTSNADAVRARQARAQRARASANRAVRPASQPQFRVDEFGTEVPSVHAEAAIVYNPENGEVLWEENSQNQRSIASITKVMTVAVFLENSPDLTQQVVVSRQDVRRASTTYLRRGETLSTGDLLHLLLIASDNVAARTLARVSPYGTKGFIARMNEKAAELGLESTHYEDPSGLLATNVSSAYDMARLIAYVAGDERVAAIMQTPRYSVTVGRRTINVKSTNQLLTEGDLDVLGGKTGFIRKAGYCLVTLLRLPEGSQVAVVILGAQSSLVRFWEARHLFNWLSSRTSEFFAANADPAIAPILLR